MVETNYFKWIFKNRWFWIVYGIEAIVHMIINIPLISQPGFFVETFMGSFVFIFFIFAIGRFIYLRGYYNNHKHL